MTEDSNIDKIIFLYLADQANLEEINILREWIKRDAANREAFENISRYWNSAKIEIAARHKEVAYAELLKRVGLYTESQATTTKLKTQKISKLPFFSAAAIIVVSIFFSFLVYFFLEDQDLQNISDSVVVNENPAGQKSMINLPDGSTVWLNARSSISYTENFSDSVRKVKLSGEAFFDIVKDAGKPFTVDVEGLNINVLGTKFNVKAYPEDLQTNVSLVSGKVKVEKHKSRSGQNAYFLSPGEALEYSLVDGEIRKKTFNVVDVTAWKEGILVLNNDSFESFKKKLEMWYGVEVNVSGKPSDDFIVTGKFRNENMENVLRALQFSRDFEFDIEGKVLTIKFRNMSE